MSYRFAFTAALGGEKSVLPLPDPILEQMCAGAFGSLSAHLRALSDEVQNIDMMTIGGFCRNCLAKWMVLEARKLSTQLEDINVASSMVLKLEDWLPTIQALNAFAYDEAAEIVYGASYAEWKRSHQKKTTDEKLLLYKESKQIHATHEADLLKATVSGVDTQALSHRVLKRLKAGAFVSLCHHLRARSDDVQNMDLMSVTGFCRNCLAKVGRAQSTYRVYLESVQLTRSLPQYVYGTSYSKWKERHQKKATADQLDRYNASKGLHAKHDKELLSTRGNPVVSVSSPKTIAASVCERVESQNNQISLLSDVCCQDVDAIATAGSSAISQQQSAPLGSLNVRALNLKVGILTVSDRAASNQYETGDLSGPAVETAVMSQVNATNERYQNSISIDSIIKHIVPDESDCIKQILLAWSGKSKESRVPLDLILTTGGTGFGKRDVTPEATVEVLDRECQGMMAWASAELSAIQPLAALSRAAAGTCGETLVVNLPGNPKGAQQVLNFLFPLLLHAIDDLHAGAGVS
ncbi:hypothetical protein THAOC_32862 [Thalassiosira oceanica]|uniref:molybdopterin molybdotransferase n=1 Tax=Thalassiosira oceanica TaxID=159749 RepID=K0R893_THAOC|nr:hypothetical protein THAOC_32862 [Thalassiosira oceanica]|eukprot:EJK48354.1 hypothetical protein THAOC_32862 [Thalassiosira oceanica]